MSSTANTTTPNNAEEPMLSDEQILEFEQQIKDEEAQKVNSETRQFMTKTYNIELCMNRYLLSAKMSLLLN